VLFFLEWLGVSQLHRFVRFAVTVTSQSLDCGAPTVGPRWFAAVLDRLYGGYGESLPRGKGPAGALHTGTPPQGHPSPAPMSQHGESTGRRPQSNLPRQEPFWPSAESRGGVGR